MANVTYIQGASGKAFNASSVSAAFSLANTQHSLVWLAVMYYNPTDATYNTYPNFSVVSANGNSYTLSVSRKYDLGSLSVAVFHCLDVAAGSESLTVNITGAPGNLFLAIHEVAPATGQKWFTNAGADTSFIDGITVGQDFSFLQGRQPASPGVVGGIQQTVYNAEFACFNYENINPTTTPPSQPYPQNNRQYVANNTPFDTGSTLAGGAHLFFLGSLSTYDAICNGPSGTGSSFYPQAQTFFVAMAGWMSFLCKAPTVSRPVATPDSGTYAGPQTVSLSQPESMPMYYTLDGSYPTVASTLYTGPITVSDGKTINVYVYDSSLTLQSATFAFTYVIQPPIPANSTITISWERRTRIGGSWLGGTGTVPLSEESELYNLYIMDPTGTTVIRSVQGLTTNSFVYTPAMQYNDFGSYVASVYVKVVQVSAAVGEGYAAINPLLGLGGQTTGGGANATQILGDNISGSASDGDILRYNATTSTWDVIGPVLKRQAIVKTTASLANNATETGSLTVFCGMFGLIKIEVDRDCRVQLYSTAAFRDADASRGYDTLPSAGGENGIIADFGFDSGGAQNWVCSSALIGANVDGTPVENIYYRVTNLSGSTSPVQVTLTIVPLEIL